MAVPDVMHVVAVKIHVAAAGHVLDVDAFGLGDGVQAGRRNRLAQKMTLIRLQQRARGVIERPRLPGSATPGEIGVALRLRDWL
jgi:hypothetical protein